mmetsp:Transcript_54522/g.100896  ORF Transcript_54522/g.100896 Transcript_54522/m.100896 type:complete len:239 (-) Transcript_54522:140-856(-)
MKVWWSLIIEPHQALALFATEVQRLPTVSMMISFFTPAGQLRCHRHSPVVPGRCRSQLLNLPQLLAVWMTGGHAAPQAANDQYRLLAASLWTSPSLLRRCRSNGNRRPERSYRRFRALRRQPVLLLLVPKDLLLRCLSQQLLAHPGECRLLWHLVWTKPRSSLRHLWRTRTGHLSGMDCFRPSSQMWLRKARYPYHRWMLWTERWKSYKEALLKSTRHWRGQERDPRMLLGLAIRVNR